MISTTSQIRFGSVVAAAVALLILVVSSNPVQSFTVVSPVVKNNNGLSTISRIQQDDSHSNKSNNNNNRNRRDTGRYYLATTATAVVNGEDTASSSKASSSSSTNIRLNISEKAKTVTSVCTSGTLCTVSYENGIEGAPFGSFVDYVLDDNGSPILLMNDMSMHTINIQKAMQQNPDNGAMVTLFTQLGSTTTVGGGATAGPSTGKLSANALQDVSRCSITGVLTKLSASDPMMDSIRMKYSLTHSYADQVMDSPKFAFYRLTPNKIYFVGGFGVLAKWVDPLDYQLASPDILAKEASSISERINRDHIDDLQYVGQHLLNVTSEIEIIRVTNIDRLGMDIRVTSQQGTRRNKKQTDEFRIGFRIPVRSIEDAKSEVLKIFQDAWEIGNGYTWNSGDGTDTAASIDVEDPTIIPVMKIAADSLE